MPKMRLLQTNFTAGEISPLMAGRTDYAKYANGLSIMENLISLPHGPAMKRPGLRYMATVKNSTQTSRLLPFQFSTTQAYMLEFGEEYIRFYMNQAQITSGGLPYEVATPYLQEHLDGIKYCQSADTMYLFHELYASRKLTRTGHTAWTLTTIDWKPPATSIQEWEPAVAVTPEATTGTGKTFTTNSAFWQNGDVGQEIVSGSGRAIIRNVRSTTVVTADITSAFASTSQIASGSWSLYGSPAGMVQPSAIGPVGATVSVSGDTTSGRVNLVGDVVSDNWWTQSPSDSDEYYLNQTAGAFLYAEPAYLYIDNVSRVKGTLGALTSNQWGWGDNDTLGYSTVYVRIGSDPDTKYATPEFVQGAGSLNIFRSTDVGKYIIINGGVIEITGYTSVSQVTGIIDSLLDDADVSMIFTVEASAWNASEGYPSCGTFFEDRLFVASTTNKPQTIWGSKTGDYENFGPGVNDDDGISYTIGSREVNKILWLEPRDMFIVGTTSGEWRFGPSDSGTPLTPLNVIAKQQTTYGSMDMMPVTIAQSTLFAQTAGRKIREFVFKWETDGFTAPDMCRMAEHITYSGIKDIAYQKEPWSLLWVCLNDGSLICMTFLRDEDVVAWHRHPMGTADVESLCCIPGDGYDELWAIVERTVNSATVRYVEMLEATFDDTAATYETNNGLNAFFVDSGLSYSGVAATTISGLDHLNGETVAILADGAVVPNQAVVSGDITLSTAASVVHAGLPISVKLTTLRPEAGMKDGTAQGRIKRVTGACIRVDRSGAFSIGRDADNQVPIAWRDTYMVMDAEPDLYTGDKYIGIDGRFDREGKTTITQATAAPLTIVSIMTDIEIEPLT